MKTNLQFFADPNPEPKPNDSNPNPDGKNPKPAGKTYTQDDIGKIRWPLRTCLVSFKNYLQEGQYNHLKTAVKGTFTVFPKSPTFV